jgi:DNA invertase Pin-like site-specific DNA recombinase
MNTNGKQLRFAAMVRVSTEKQEQQGESLHVQRNSNIRDVEKLGGKIVQWYGGQEHATEGWERKEVDRLIADASKGKFNAVIVAYADRWSRDNAKSKEGLEAFRKNSIKFYVGTLPLDLFSPEHRLMLGINAEIGEFIALQQQKKSLQSKIERARQGKPTCGSLPYGRTYSKEVGWGIDLEKQALIKDVAERYLRGVPMTKMARELGVNKSNLIRLLRERCGGELVIEFNSDKLDIHETVTLAVPSLLDDALLKAVRERLKANRTNLHKPPRPKYEYLLSGRVFCAACGYTLVGQTNHENHRYYAHTNRDADNLCPCKPRPWVRADWLEGEVTRQLFEMFGNPAAIEKAIRRAVPDGDDLAKRKAKLDADLAKLGRSRDNILRLVDDDALTYEQAKGRLASIKEREEHLREESDKLAEQLVNLPDEDTLRRYVERFQDDFGSIKAVTVAVRDENHNTHSASGYVSGEYGTAYFAQDEDGDVSVASGEDVNGFLNAVTTKDDRRHLIDAVFARTMTDGKPAGIYVSPVAGPRFGSNKRSRKWKFTLKGMLECETVIGEDGRSVPNDGCGRWTRRRPRRRRR